MKQHTQRGSVFFYILMAVVLLAALSYAASRGSRTGASSLTDQQAKLAAQEIIDYGNTVANAVQKLRLRGCADTEISFANDTYTSYGGTILQTNGHNINSPSDGSCELYKSSGANINSWEIPMSSSFEWSISNGNSNYGVINVRYSAIPGIGSSEQDLILVGIYLKKDVCLKINNLLGIDNPSGNVPNITGGSMFVFNASSYSGSYALSDNDNVITGKTAFCAQNAVTIPGSYIQVLIAR